MLFKLQNVANIKYKGGYIGCEAGNLIGGIDPVLQELDPVVRGLVGYEEGSLFEGGDVVKGVSGGGGLVGSNCGLGLFGGDNSGLIHGSTGVVGRSHGIDEGWVRFRHMLHGC